GAQQWRTAYASDGTEWRLFEGAVSAGTWQYLIDVGGVPVLDEANPRTAYTADPDGQNPDPLGTEVSELVMPDCTQPALETIDVQGGTDSVRVRARFVHGHAGPALDPAAMHAELWQGGAQLDAPTVERDGPAGIVVRASGLQPGKYIVRLTAAD